VRTDVARLAGARFVSTSETESGKQLAESLIKQMTGEDTIVARLLYKNEFEYIPQYKIFLATNHKPIIKGADNGIWRRIRLIPFAVTIPDEEQDKSLKEQLRAEFPGILASLVRGCLAWQQHGLQPPVEVTAATEYYRQEMDVIGEFIREQCIVMPLAKATAKALYEGYTNFCEQNGEQPIEKHDFGRQLTARGFRRDHSRSGSVWFGIGLVTDVTHGDPDSGTSIQTPVI
jgi:putative DNA primase/helicase